MIEMPVPVPPAAPTQRTAGQMVVSVLGYALSTLLMFVSPLVVFVPAALLHCGIRNGRRAAWVVAAIAGPLAIALAALLASAPRTELADAHAYLAYQIALVLAVAIPSLIILPLVAEGVPSGPAVVVAVLLAAAGLGVTEAGMRATTGFSPYHDQVTRARAAVAQVIEKSDKGGVPADRLQTLQRLMDVGMQCLPAFFLMDITAMFVLSLVMVGRLLAWRNLLMRRLEPEAEVFPVAPLLFRNFSLPEWLIVAFIIGGVSPLLTGVLHVFSANVLAIVAFLYLLQGLAIFRSILLAVGAGFFGTALAWAGLGLLSMTGIPPLVLAIAGLFDSFFDFRHFNRKDDSHEGDTD